MLWLPCFPSCLPSIFSCIFKKLKLACFPSSCYNFQFKYSSDRLNQGLYFLHFSTSCWGEKQVFKSSDNSLWQKTKTKKPFQNKTRLSLSTKPDETFGLSADKCQQFYGREKLKQIEGTFGSGALNLHKLQMSYCHYNTICTYVCNMYNWQIFR